MANEDSFVKLPAKLLFSPDYSNEAKIVYAALKWHCFGKDSCYPGIETIQKETTMSIFKCKRAFKELYNKGAIQKKRRGLGQTNIYYLNDRIF